MEVPQRNFLCTYLKQTKMSFFLLQNWRIGGQNLGTGTSGRGEKDGKGYRMVNMVKYCVHMYINGKMRLLETIPGMRGIKGEWWRE
jgi:hypothetical protein